MALAALAAGAGIAPETIRAARDDATAPHAEIPAAALRRVWLWALAGVASSGNAASIAAAVSRPTVRRAKEAVDSWYERDAATADALDACAGMIEALATVATTRALGAAASRQALKDRHELDRRRRARAPVSAAARELSRRMRELAAEARANGDDERAARLEPMAKIRRPRQVRTRDLHRVRASAPAL